MKRITLLTILVFVLVFIPLSGFYVDVEAGQIKYSITLGVLRFVDVLTAGLRKLAFTGLAILFIYTLRVVHYGRLKLSEEEKLKTYCVMLIAGGIVFAFS